MSLLYQNVRGLRTKLSNVYIQSFHVHYQIIVLTETWLNNTYLNTEILCNKYNIYRRDRGTHGGGVLIAVSSSLHSEQLVNQSLIDIEFVSVVIKMKHKNIIITCSYIPPSSTHSLYIQHADAIRSVANSFNKTDSFIIMGDFNMPSVVWNYLPDDNYYVQSKLSDCWNDFFNILYDMSLFQINGIMNDYLKILDLIFVNDIDDCYVKRTTPISVPEDRYHPAIELFVSIPPDCVLQPLVSVKSYCFKRTNYILLNELILNTNWYDILIPPVNLDVTLEDTFGLFYHKMYSFMDLCIPKQIMKPLSGPPWNNKQLCRAKNKKNKLYNAFKRTGSSVDYFKYSVSRAEYTKLNSILYKNYLTATKFNFKRNPKSFYKFVNSKKKSSGYPAVMTYQQKVTTDDDLISGMFAEFFATTYSVKLFDDTIEYPFPLAESQPISLPNFDIHMVISELIKLKFSYDAGPDKIPSCILINCAEALAIPLTMLFNLSIKYGYFPDIWKSSFIVPLFKSGNKSEIENYRGIAKLSTIPKLFEKIITDNIYYQVASIISPCQHGFQKGCSTSTNLLHLTITINRGFLQRMQTDVIYTDFRKAFDKVNHLLLIKKLQTMGFTNLSIKWIYSYLTNRSQIVRFRSKLSKSITVPSGVPQGSHLGPLLFSLFINDLPTIIKCSSVLMYADDVKIFLSYNKFMDHKLLQMDLDSLYEWCNVNLMELNLNKCKVMRFARSNHIIANYVIGDHQLDLVESFLDLGILLDPKLNFIDHITFAINKARATLGFIKRWSKEFNDPYIGKALYMSLVRPILEYGSIIWDPIYQIHSDAIESVQKQFMLFCLRGLRFNPVNLPSYSSRLALIKLPTLKSRRTMLNVSFVFNIIKGDICSGFLINEISFNVPQRTSRNFIPLLVKVYRANYADADPLRRMCYEFNQLYRFIDFSLNANVVKNAIVNFLNS